MNHNKQSSSLIVWLVAGPLLLYSGYHNLNLLLSVLPSGAASVIAGLCGLVALDVGVVCWLIASGSARGAQRVVTMLMVILDLVGLSIGMIADSALVGNVEEYRSLVSTAVTFVLPIIIALNVGGTVLMHLLDPDVALRNAERGIEDRLRAALAQHLEDNSSEIAGRAVPKAAQHRADELVAAFLASTRRDEPSTNGRRRDDLVAMNADGADGAPGSKSGRKR